MRSLVNLAKAAASVALAPVAAVADFAALPSDAYDGREAFSRARGLLANAGKCVTAAVDPEADEQ